jgi:mRNA-decapping enzyme subunit 2
VSFVANSDIVAVVVAVVVYAVFNSCNALRPYRAHLDDIYKDFTHYKFRVPVSGAIILDDTHDRVILPFTRIL